MKRLILLLVVSFTNLAYGLDSIDFKIDQINSVGTESHGKVTMSQLVTDKEEIKGIKLELQKNTLTLDLKSSNILDIESKSGIVVEISETDILIFMKTMETYNQTSKPVPETPKVSEDISESIRFFKEAMTSGNANGSITKPIEINPGLFAPVTPTAPNTVIPGFKLPTTQPIKPTTIIPGTTINDILRSTDPIGIGGGGRVVLDEF
ncbi:MAG: hypothetical protein Fur0010_04540 [Bdellovibrio sp.]